MKVTVELAGTYTAITLAQPIIFKKFRVIKAFINSNGMNHTNNILLFSVNNLTDAAIYNPNQSVENYDLYSFSITAPANQIIGYDRLMDSWDYQTEVENKIKIMTVYVFNNMVDLSFGVNTKISIEIEFV